MTSFEYIEQVEKLKKTAPFKVPNDYFRAFRSDLQGLPGVEFNLVNGGDDVWTRISRLTEDAPPDPPESLRAWVSIPKTPEKTPELRTEISVKKDNQEKRFTLDQFPGMGKILDKYVAEHWALMGCQRSGHSSKRPSLSTTSSSPSSRRLKPTAEKLVLETVWGMGFRSLKKEGAPATIEHPLLSQTL